MPTVTDGFLGTWKLDPARSEFGPHHQPTAATMSWSIDADGTYMMTAQGTNAKGEPVVERPQRMVPDGQPQPVPDFPGLTAVSTRPDPRTVRCEVRREDGSLVGEGVFVLSIDGRTLTAVNSGFDTQLRRFEQRTVWERDDTQLSS
jgi:hypothetical protein